MGSHSRDFEGATFDLLSRAIRSGALIIVEGWEINNGNQERNKRVDAAPKGI